MLGTRQLPLNGRSANVVDLTDNDHDESKEDIAFTYPFAKSPEEERDVFMLFNSEDSKLPKFSLNGMGFLFRKSPLVNQERSSKQTLLSIGQKEIQILNDGSMLNDKIVDFFVIWYVRYNIRCISNTRTPCAQIFFFPLV